jgi:hypothetical protein
MAGREMQQRFGGQTAGEEEDPSVRLLIPAECSVADRNSSDLEHGEIVCEDRPSSDPKHTKRAGPQETPATKNFMKNASLALLAVQNCCLILSMKYSKIQTPPDGKRYLSTTVVVVVRLVFPSQLPPDTPHRPPDPRSTSTYRDAYFRSALGHRTAAQSRRESLRSSSSIPRATTPPSPIPAPSSTLLARVSSPRCSSASLTSSTLAAAFAASSPRSTPKWSATIPHRVHSSIS